MRGVQAQCTGVAEYAARMGNTGFLGGIFDSDWTRRGDINENRDRLRRLRRANRRKSKRDSKQNRRIKTLENEVDQLELLLAGLVQTMVDKSLLTRAEIDQIVAGVAAAQDPPDEDDDD